MQLKTTKSSLFRLGLLFTIALLFNQNLMAQKPMPTRSFEISLEADEKIETEIKPFEI